MIVRTFSEALENFDDLCETISKDEEIALITREQGANVMLLTESTLNNLKENLFVRQNPKAYRDLIKSIEQLEKVRGIK